MDTVQDRLYAELSAEYDAFIDNLKAKTPGEIIDSSYEKTYKEEILINCESGSIGDKEAAALLALDNPLDELYRNWLHTDVSVAEDIRDSILGSARQEIERQGLSENVQINTPTEERTATIPEESPAQVINGTVDIGDWVIPVTEKAYSGLIGQVIAVDKLGTNEHKTDNPGDAVHVDFTRVDYQPDEVLAIEANFAKLYGEHKPFAELPLDDVIMAPEMLVSLVGRDIEPVDELTESYGDAKEFANRRLNMHFDNLENALIERIEQNYADYQQTLQSFGANELIDMAAKIHAMSDAYSYATAWHGWNDDEIDFYLQFANPLAVIADAWHERNIDLDEMSFTMDFIMGPERQRSALEMYPPYTEKPMPDVEIKMIHEADLTPRERLESKMEKEFSAFIWKTERKPAHEIIESAYQKVFMEDILLTVKNADLSDEQIDALLSLDTPLDDLYWSWLDSDVSYMDTLRDCVEEYADAIISERSAEQEKAEPLAQQPLIREAEPVAEEQVTPVETPPDASEKIPKPQEQATPAKRVLPPVKPESQKKQSLTSQLDAAIEEARELNAARTPQISNKSKNKEID
ncbi:hypothetical protein FACS1894219_00040 [Clostridia bacterium]|nr:hypothetical protein FACS1894219_00040 [Clostridia bacterium]